MTRIWTASALAIALAASAAAAWSQTRQPYAGLEARPIKALSDQQVADLKAGRGMGLALAAELNGYPGPLHVLELAASLDLTAGQRARVAQLFEAMKAEAVPLGEKVIAAEALLDRQFATRSVNEASLSEAVQEIAATQGALRTAHLKYHLAMLEVLTPDQVTRYIALRGYAGNASGQATPHHHR